MIAPDLYSLVLFRAHRGQDWRVGEIAAIRKAGMSTEALIKPVDDNKLYLWVFLQETNLRGLMR